MNHPSENLSAYLDGELTDAEARAIEAQLASDPDLMAELNELKEAQDFIRSHGPIQAPPAFYAKVLSALDDEPMQQSWWNWLSRPFGLPVQGLAVAAVAALVLILAIPFGAQQFVLNSGKEDLRSKSADELASSSRYGRDKVKSATGAKEGLKNQTMAQDEPEPSGLGQASDELDSTQEMLNVIPDKKETNTKDVDLDDRLSNQLTAGQADDEKQASRGTGATGLEPNSKEMSKGKESLKSSKPLGATTGYVYTIQTDDPDALYNLFTLVKRYKGSLVDSSGRAVSPSELKRGQSLNLQVFINEKSLNLLDRQLGNLGSVKRSMPKSSELTSGGLHRLRINLNRSGSSSAPNSVQFEPTYPSKKNGSEKGK